MGFLDFLFGTPSTTAKTSSTTNENTSGSSVTNKTPYGPAVGPINSFLANSPALNPSTPGISGMEQSGYNSIAGAAGAASVPGSGVNAAGQANTDTINGKYLTPETNPYLADMGRQIAGTTMAGINSTFGGAGRTGSGLDQYFSGKGVADSLSNLYGGEYNAERQLQQSAIGQAPALQAATFVPGAEQASAGQQISARPFDVGAQQASILASIAGLGGTQNTDATQVGTTNTNGTATQQKNGWLLSQLFPG